MDRSATREGLGIAATFFVAALSFLLTLQLAASTTMGFLGGPTGESGVTPGALPYAELTANTLLVLLPVLLAPLALHGTGFGARIPRRPRGPRFLTATALTWLAMGATGVANPWIRAALGHDIWTGVSSTQPISDPEMTFIAVTAGLGEEATHLAIPTGFAYLIGVLVNLVRERQGRPLVPAGRLWLMAATIGPGLALSGRAAGHLYQGPVSAVLALAWGAALAGVFLWARSIWPIMLGHFIYNIPVHYDSWAATIAHHVLAPAMLVVLGLIALRVSPRATDRRRQVAYTS